MDAQVCVSSFLNIIEFSSACLGSYTVENIGINGNI